MMSLLNSTASLCTIEWEDGDYYLHDFCRKYALPQVAKITKGQYLNLGVPTITSPSLNQNVLLAQSAKSLKVAAQCVKFKDNNRVVPVGTKLAIPDNYDGWFEILSEDGRAARCIESVLELLRVFPDMCLVRENIKAYLPKTDNAEVISDKTRTVNAGETLVLISEVHVTPSKSKFSGRYIRCFTSKGETIYLSAQQKGKFSPIAGEDGISGVHTIKNLILKRFPLMVRLVHGQPPTGGKISSHFVSEMRLYSLFEEESIVALPIQKDSHVVPLPPSAHLKVQAPKNVEYLMKLRNYGLLVERCKNLVLDSSNKIQVFDISMSKELRGDKAALKKATKKHLQRETSLGSHIQRSVSDPSSKYKDPTRHNSVDQNCRIEVTNSYDEIDQIYDYIRGFAPLPSKTSYAQDALSENVSMSVNHSSTPSSSATTSNSNKSSKSGDAKNEKPKPPPIETIPGRRCSKEDITALSTDRASKSLDSSEESDMDGHIYETIEKFKVKPKNNEKMFISHPVSNGFNKFLKKSPAQQRILHKSKFLKHSKSSPAFRDVPVQKVCERQRTTRSKSLITSPLFNMRYKSLVNLANDFDTLDSSNSGGEGSYFSGGLKKLQKRKCKLMRPKSLTDLFESSNQVSNIYTHRNGENAIHGIENRKLIFCHEFENRKCFNGHQSKRIGTLYL